MTPQPSRESSGARDFGDVYNLVTERYTGDLDRDLAEANLPPELVSEVSAVAADWALYRGAPPMIAAALAFQLGLIGRRGVGAGGAAPMTQQPSVESSEPVSWEMVVRWPWWKDELSIAVRALDRLTIEIKATTQNGCGAATGARSLTFAEVRRALDELERSAREVERL